MLLLLSWRNGRQRRAPPLLVTAVLLCLVPVCAGLPAGSKCPPISKCLREGRQFCQHGSSHCGPCLSSLVENKEGRCVVRERPRMHEQTASFADPDEEIDLLQSVIAKQEVTESQAPKNSAVVPLQKDAEKPRTQASQRKVKRPSHDTTAAAPLPDTPTPQPRVTGPGGRGGPVVVTTSKNDKVIIIVISVCVVVGAVAVILAAVCFVELQKGSRLAQKVDYPSFRGADAPATASNSVSAGDKTLVQSAQMYHYQHQKQQMLAVANHKPEQNVHEPEATSDEEEVGGDFTVYECPGLAPTGEMEVKNPLFDDSNLHYQENHK